MIAFAPVNHGLAYPIGHLLTAPECSIRSSFLGCFKPKGQPSDMQRLRPERRVGALNRVKALFARADLLTLIYPGFQLSCGPQQSHPGPDELKIGVLESVVFFE